MSGAVITRRRTIGQLIGAAAVLALIGLGRAAPAPADDDELVDFEALDTDGWQTVALLLIGAQRYLGWTSEEIERVLRWMTVSAFREAYAGLAPIRARVWPTG